MKRRPLLLATGAALVGGLAPAARNASAQTAGWPNKPVRLVVPYAAGGLPDTVARVVAQRLAEPLGQPVVVENRPGANGAVAAAALAASPPDGHTLLVTDGSMFTINPLIYRKMTYDPAKDFVPVSLIARSPLFMAVHPSVAADSLDAFIALARANPGRLNYGSSGVGSSHHLTVEAMKASLGIFMTHIPFRGSAASVPALVGGHVDMVFSALPSLQGFVKTGQVKLLATNSARRSPLAPNVAAVSEKIPGFDFAVAVVMMAPTGTPQPVVQRLSEEIARVARRADVIEQLATAGIDAVGSGPGELVTALAEEAGRARKAVDYAGIKPE
ncbi:MAG: tripartite tricarboxylate transporter substrate-binding protein [Burkholderiales bacterium]|jgi:tripartite-type tricarboxylate transporter receptor subunit TctC